MLRHDFLARTPFGWAATNSNSTWCAAFRPELKSAIQSRSRVYFGHTAGPRTADNLARNSTRNGPANRLRPAVATPDRSLRPVAEA